MNRQVGKSWALGAAYGMSGIPRELYGGSKGKWDMRQIGGSVIIIGNKFAAQRKLFMQRGEHTGLIYVKNARKHFEPLCVDGTLSSGRTWSELKIPDDYKCTDGGVADGGHVTVMNIVDAARDRLLGNPTVYRQAEGRIFRK